MVNPYEPPASDVVAAPTVEVSKKKGALNDHQMAGRSLKALGWLQAIAVCGIYAAILIPAFKVGRLPPPKDLLFLLSILLPIFSMLVGRAVSNQIPWGRNVAYAYCALMLLGFPMGTLVGAYILFYLIRDRG